MKKVLIFIVFVVCCLASYSQSERINWIIFIDGKLSETTVLSGKIICFENTLNEKIIDFEYAIGGIIVSTDDLNYIKENYDSIKKITVKLYYQEFTKKTSNLYIYPFDVSPTLLSSSYVVLRIFNFDKKKGTFHFGYTTDEYSTFWYHKEPHIFATIDRQIAKRGVTTDTIIMKRIVFIPTNIPKNKKGTKMKGEVKIVP
jgi:hypothetical protein